MTALFMFFRVWRGFPDSFPFDRFNRLSDEELERALQSHAMELAQDPEVQARVKRDQAAFVARLREAEKKFLNPVNPGISREPRGSKPLGAFPARKLDKLTLWRDVLNRVYHPCGGEIPEWSPGGRVWFYEATSGEFAEQLVIELNKCRNLDYRGHQAEIEFNPRYGLVSAGELSAGQQAAIRRCIRAIRDGEEPAVANGKVALVLGEKALQVAEELSSAWRPSTPDQATTDTGSMPAKVKNTKRGRKRLSREETQRRMGILAAWEKARNAGTPRKTFCREQEPSLSVKELEKIIAWKATRDRRKAGN